MNKKPIFILPSGRCSTPNGTKTLETKSQSFPERVGADL